MRELYLMDEESTETFFVLRDDEGIRYQLARSEMQAVAEEESTKPELEVAPDAQEPSADADNALGDEHSEDAAETASEEKPRSLPEPDPLYSTPLSMRPNQIQARIRSGTQPSELAEEMGVAESRIDPYAHPVLLERSQVAEAAKQSHPMREDGPAKLTLFEILATPSLQTSRTRILCSQFVHSRLSIKTSMRAKTPPMPPLLRTRMQSRPVTSCSTRMRHRSRRRGVEKL